MKIWKIEMHQSWHPEGGNPSPPPPRQIEHCTQFYVSEPAIWNSLSSEVCKSMNNAELFKERAPSDQWVTSEWPVCDQWPVRAWLVSDQWVAREWPASDQRVISEWPVSDHGVTMEWPGSDQRVTSEWPGSDQWVSSEWPVNFEWSASDQRVISEGPVSDQSPASDQRVISEWPVSDQGVTREWPASDRLTFLSRSSVVECCLPPAACGSEPNVAYAMYQLCHEAWSLWRCLKVDLILHPWVQGRKYRHQSCLWHKCGTVTCKLIVEHRVKCMSCVVTYRVMSSGECHGTFITFQNCMTLSGWYIRE